MQKIDPQLHVEQHGGSSRRIQALEAEVTRLKGLLESSTFRHPIDAEIVHLGRSMAHNMSGDGFLFQDREDLITFCRELLTGESPSLNMLDENLHDQRQTAGHSNGQIKTLEMEIARLNSLLDTATFRHPTDTEIETLGRRIAKSMTGDYFLFVDESNLIDFCRELLTGEAHINGYPVISQLPNAPVSIRNNG